MSENPNKIIVCDQNCFEMDSIKLSLEEAFPRCDICTLFFPDEIEEVMKTQKEKISGIITEMHFSGDGKVTGGNLFKNENYSEIYKTIVKEAIPTIVFSSTGDLPYFEKYKERVESDCNTWLIKCKTSCDELINICKKQFRFEENAD